MKTNKEVRFRLHAATTIVLPLLLTTLTSSATLAQPPGGPGGFGGGPGGGEQGRPGGPGMPPFGRPGQASVADVPVTMLEPGLSLTADQKTKIAAIQQQFQKLRQTMRPGPGGFGGPGGRPGGPEGGPGGGPDDQGGPNGPGRGPGSPGGPGTPGGQGGPDGGPSGPGGPMDGMRELQQQTSKKIEALLTTTQKQALPTLLKEFDALRATGIPAETYGDLKLTADQKTKLASIAQKAQQTMRQTMEKARQGGDFESMRKTMQQSRQQSQKEALNALSTEQRQTIDKYRKAHPRPEGGPDGPPPPPPGN